MRPIRLDYRFQRIGLDISTRGRRLKVHIRASNRQSTTKTIVFTARYLPRAFPSTQAYDSERIASETNSNIRRKDESEEFLD